MTLYGRTLIRGFCCFKFCKANVLISVNFFYEKLERFKFFGVFPFPFWFIEGDLVGLICDFQVSPSM